jgi:hypothetical protein
LSEVREKLPEHRSAKRGQAELTVRRPTNITLSGLVAAFTSPAVVAMIWAAAFVIVWGICTRLPQHVTRWDFSIYFMSVTLLHEGRNPYTSGFGPIAERTGLQAGDISHATDPPTFLLCMEPFALIGERAGFYIWFGLNVIFLAAALVMLLGRPSRLEPRIGMSLAGLALLYPPVEWHFLAAQSKIPVLLLLVVMMRSMERGWDRLAGLCLAFAGLIRVFPLLLIGYLVIQRRWRVLHWTVIGLVTGGLITVGLIGVERSFSFFVHGQRDLVHHWLSYPANIALAGAVSRLFWFIAGQQPGGIFDFLRQTAIAAADATLLAATVWATLQLEPGEDCDWRAFSMWVVASVLLSPTAWTYYMILFFIPFAQLAAAANRGTASRRAEIASILSYLTMILASLVVLRTPGTIYSHLDDMPTVRYLWWIGEGAFVSAMLVYMSALWFTTDKLPAFDKVMENKQDIGVSPGTVAGII